MDMQKALADARLQRELDRLEDEGVELLAAERLLLIESSEESRDAWLASLHRAAAARVPRQVVRYQAPRRSDAERKFAVYADQWAQHERTWRVTARNEAKCEVCGYKSRPHETSAEAATDAQLHLRKCGSRDG